VKRALLLVTLALAAAGRLAAQEPVPPAPKPDTTRTDTLRVDTLRADSLRLDSLRLDSLRLDSLRLDSLRLDSLRADSLRADSLRADSLAHQDTTARREAAPEALLRPGVQLAYRRTPTFTRDDFRYALVPHWGFVIAVGASGINNSVNFSDIGALTFLNKKDSLGPANGIDALGLVPAGKGLLGFLQGGGSFNLGGPFGRHVGLGLSAGGHAYSSFRLDDNTVALLRDGNGARQDFSIGTSGGAALATAEAGGHLVMRFGATGDQAGWRFIAGVGARYLKPLAYARGGSVLPGGGTIRLTGDSIAITSQVESQYTYQSQDGPMKVKGSGVATDLLFRFEMPRPGVAFEVSLANLGSVKIQGVERRRANISGVHAASIKELRDILMFRDTTISPRQGNPGLDTSVTWKLKKQYDFNVVDTSQVTVTLPRVLRFAASTWILPMLQLDAAYTASVTGDFAAPAMLEAGATLRLLRWIPLRVGVISAGAYGTGLTGGFGIETRVFYLDLSGATLGGGFKTGRGAGANVEFGFFF
jgi:hypothetical protein